VVTFLKLLTWYRKSVLQKKKKIPANQFDLELCPGITLCHKFNRDVYFLLIMTAIIVDVNCCRAALYGDYKHFN